MGSHGSAMGFAENSNLQPGSDTTRHSSKAQPSSGLTAHAQQPAASAFAELDANQDPLQRFRFTVVGKDAISMGDQGQQQPGQPAAAPAASWSTFLSGFQQQAYASPGARAAGRGRGRKGHTPKAASRMQQRPAAAAGDPSSSAQGAAAFGNPAAPMFAFGSPMQPAGSAAAADAAVASGPAQRTGSTPTPSTLRPGSAMSMDTALPETFTAAFSAMSVDAATPAFGTNSGSSQQWAFRGPRAAAVTGKRLFDTPSSAGGDSSSPSPFGSWGGPAAGSGSAQQAVGAGTSRGAETVPFPGFGSAQEGSADASSPAGGFAFNPGKPGSTPGRKARQQRGSPAQKPPPAPPSFGGFGSPAFHAGRSSSAATPGSMPSASSFQGFFANKVPGSAATTPGFSPMMWSPADPQAAQPSAAAPAASAPGPGFSFGDVAGRQQSSAALQQETEARMQQAAVQLAQEQARADAAETLAAHAVDLPDSEDSAEEVAELLTDLSTSDSCAAQAAPAETAAMAGLRAAVNQLSTADKQEAPQQSQPAQPAAVQQPQQQPAVPSFVFGSPDHVGTGFGRTASTWLSSPGDPSGVPTTLFEMSPLKSAEAASKQRAAATATSAALSQPGAAPASAAAAAAPAAPVPVFTADTAHAAAGSSSTFAPSTGSTSAPSFAATGAAAAGGGFSFTPGKGSGPSRAPARAKKPTPVKQQKAPAPAAAPAAQRGFGFAPTGASAAAAGMAAGQSSSLFGQQHQQAEDGPQAASVFGGFGSSAFGAQQEQQQWPANGAPTPGRRKLHAQQRRANLAGGQQAQQQHASSAQVWPPSATQQAWAPAAATSSAAPPAPSVSFTLGSGKSTGAGTPARCPRKGRPAQHFPQPQQQHAQGQQGPEASDAGLQQALRHADVWTQRAQTSFTAQDWIKADGDFEQGMLLLQPYAEHAVGAQKLSNLHMHRAAVRIGGGNPEGALKDSLAAIRLHKKNIEAYLRTATCLSKLGCLTAADRVLDKVLDMVSPRHESWQALNKKRQQVHQLAHTQQRVVAAALGCDDAAAAATLAALSAGQPVQDLLNGFISVSVRQGTTAAAVAGLSEAGTSPLEDSAAAQVLIKDAQSLITELGFWEDGTAMLAWLLLRSGQLSTAANVAEAQPNGFFQKQPAHGSSKQWAWRWWVLAQVKWQQGELTEAKLLLQEGQQQLSKFAQATSNGNSSNGSSSASPSLWRLLLPSAQELTELLQQVQQLLAFKEAGNAAISAKQFDKATEAYTKALALQPSCGFAAVIHSNRAAALQQQQRLIEALADCSRAVALDPKYAKAYLRMAQVLESLHRADRAVVVLQDALKGSANAVDPATTRGHELTHGAALLQLSSADRRKFEDMLGPAQVAARRFKTPHHYKALGLAMGATEADIKKAYRGLALKHHPDKALQHCRWSIRLGRCGAAPAHMTAASGGVEASLKAAANEVFGFLSAAQEELTNATSRSKLDRDLRTEEQLYSNSGSSSSSSSYSRPAAYTYTYGGRRADADYGFEDFFRRTAANAGTSRTYQQQQQQARPQAGSRPGQGAGSGGASRAGSGGGQNRWYEQNYWDDGDLESDEDEYDYGGYAGGSGYHYRSKY